MTTEPLDADVRLRHLADLIGQDRLTGLMSVELYPHKLQVQVASGDFRRWQTAIAAGPEQIDVLGDGSVHRTYCGVWAMMPITVVTVEAAGPRRAAS